MLGVIEPRQVAGPGEGEVSSGSVRVLLDWLPRVSNERVKETMVRQLSIRTKDGVVADALISEFRKPGGANYKWVVADTLAFVCGPRHFAELTELAADMRCVARRSRLLGCRRVGTGPRMWGGG